MPNVKDKKLSIWCSSFSMVEVFDFDSEKKIKTKDCFFPSQIETNGFYTIIRYGFNKIIICQSEKAEILYSWEFPPHVWGNIISVIPVPKTDYVIFGFTRGQEKIIDSLQDYALMVILHVLPPSNKHVINNNNGLNHIS